EHLKEYHRVIGAALRVMLHDRLPAKDEIETQVVGPKAEKDGLHWRKFLLSRKGETEHVPTIGVHGSEFDGTVVVWVHPEGKSSLMHQGKLVPAAQQIIDRKAAILAPDVMWTGEARGVVLHIRTDAEKMKARQISLDEVRKAVESSLGKGFTDLDFIMSKEKAEEVRPKIQDLALREKDGQVVRLADVAVAEIGAQLPVNGSFGGYTFGYNRPLLANRVHDILTVIAMAKGREETKTIHLVGFDKAGPWVALARGLCGDAVQRTAVDFDQFSFEKVRAVSDEMMLPGGLKYGGLPALTALAAPGELFVHNQRGAGSPEWLAAAYQAAGEPGHLRREAEKVAPEKVV